MKYTAYLRWSGEYNSEGRYTYGVPYEASTSREAAQKRVARLRNPLEYDGVAVVGNDEVVIFDIVVPEPQPAYKLVQR